MTTINSQNQNIPAYSGITINITNPTLNPPPIYQNCAVTPSVQNNNVGTTQYSMIPENNQNEPNQIYSEKQNYNTVSTEAQNIQRENNLSESKVITPEKLQDANSREQLPQAYPAPYYLNNYNYIQNGEKIY